MYRDFLGLNDAGGDRYDHGVRNQLPPTPAVLAPVGKIQATNGLVAIAHANVAATQSAIGDFIYQGDVIETGCGGGVAIEFVDGTTFNLGGIRASW